MKCLFRHKWSKWLFESIDNDSKDKLSNLKRKCSKCGCEQTIKTFKSKARRNKYLVY